MRTPPLISDRRYTYARLDLVKWVCGNTDSSVVLGSDFVAIEALARDGQSNLPLVIDCTCINSVEHHALTEFAECARASRRGVALIRIGSELLAGDMVPQLAKCEFKKELLDGQAMILINPSAFQAASPRNIDAAYKDCYLKHVSAAISRSLTDFPQAPKRLRSTPLLATGYWDARMLVGDPDMLCWMVAGMGDLVRKELDAANDRFRNREIRILAVSRNAAVIASAVVDCYPDIAVCVDVVDHYGPWQEVLDEYSAGSFELDCSYIFVGDFLVGGTELRLAEAYAHNRDARLDLAVVLHSALRPDSYVTKFRLASMTEGIEGVGGPTIRFADNWEAV